jgi:predicted nucleotide-binding protein
MAASSEYWHVAIEPTAAKKDAGGFDAVALDRDRDWVERRILDPRRRGETVSLDGQTFSWDDVARLRISTSATDSSAIVQRLKHEDQTSSVVILGGPGYRERAVYAAQDMTDELVDGPPGALAVTQRGTSDPDVDRRAVMVVHGRNEDARRAMFDFLRALNLKPLEWGTLIAGTGKAAPYVGEVLEHAFRRAAAVVVLFTADDEARLREQFHGPIEPDHETELTPQARPNVLFEAGMALAVHPNRTVLVELGQLRPFSDVYGRHVVRLDGSDKPLRDIAQRLLDAGCDVDRSGDDWTSPHRFSRAQQLAEARKGAALASASGEAATNEVRDLNEDTGRWLRDRDRQLQAALKQKAGELNAAGQLYSGASLQAQRILKRHALQEYRDEMTRKRRRYRDLCAAVGVDAGLAPLELGEDARSVLAGWRSPATIPGSTDTADVDDPTSETLEPDLRRFETEGDWCQSPPRGNR